ncbi:hypothetical protein ACIRJO_02850 [Streptomyces sp. NPDC102394]|uniref:hypothetical protein n=1 Tax=Streptomyces sp. NPDC102394 TaxID=3366167 RepID=UPI003830CA69
MPLEQETSNAKSQARDALYNAITATVADLRKSATSTAQAEGLKDLAEAYAWVSNTAQPH